MSEDPYAVVVGRVLDMLEPEDGDELLLLESDVIVLLRLLTAAYRRAPALCPRGSASVGPDGRLYLYWRKPERALHLMVRNAQVKLYRRQGDEYAIEDPIVPDDLVHWWEWYATGRPATRRTGEEDK